MLRIPGWVPPGHEEGKEHAHAPALHRERDYAFGQAMLKLRMSIGLTQADLADLLGISHRAVGEWEGGLNYPKAPHLQHFLELCVQQRVFAPEREEEEIRAFWKTAHQRVLLDEAWLSALLTRPSAPPATVEEAGSAAVVRTPPAPAQLSPQAETPVAHSGAEPAAFSRVDWVGALDVSHFTGREVEVAELTQWIVQECGAAGDGRHRQEYADLLPASASGSPV